MILRVPSELDQNDLIHTVGAVVAMLSPPEHQLL